MRFWFKGQRALQRVLNAVEPISKKCFQPIRHSPGLQKPVCPDPETQAVAGPIPVMRDALAPGVVVERILRKDQVHQDEEYVFSFKYL